MGITSALITGLSGLSANQSELDVVGNNIANVNTVGFKASTMNFKTQFSETFSSGSAPNGSLGGTNPIQVGLGTQAGATSRNFSDGSLEVTGVSSNLAIQGDGFFILKGQNQVYTRDGTFKLNSQNQLVSSDGSYVQGYGIDSNFNVVPGVLSNLTIPVGSLTVATATQNVTTVGNLDSSGALPTKVSSLTMNQSLYVSDGAGGVTGTAPDATTPLSQLADASGNLLFASTDTLTFSGSVGSTSTITQSLAVTPTSGPPSTLGDLMSFMTGTLGINTSAGANGNLATVPGASLVAGPAGAVNLNINGNPGADNDIVLKSSSLSIVGASGTTSPFTWNQNSSADGASVRTSAQIYDSLGNAVTADIVASMVSKTSTGTTWNFYATSPDGTATGNATQTLVGNGTLTFNTAGDLINATNTSATINRANTGAVPNLSFNIDFTSVTDQAAKSSPASSTSSSSTLAVSLQDGSPKGTLQSYTIDANGLIHGAFSAGPNRVLGQVAMATFRNNQGLIDSGNNTYTEGANSGTAIISAPGQFSAGTITSGALELGNVDLSSEFVKLISASTGFSASSKIITTSNQLLQQLLQAAG